MSNAVNKEVYKSIYNSPIGPLLMISDGEKLIGLFTGHETMETGIEEEAAIKDDLPVFLEISQWLNKYFNGEKPGISTLPIAPSGTEFRMAVWEILKRIPYGRVVTYGDIAKEMAVIRGKKKMSAQAVGGAVGSNPISIIIPCHRVIGAGGNLTGFGGGMDIKVKLLKHENVDMSGMYIPKKYPDLQAKF